MQGKLTDSNLPANQSFQNGKTASPDLLNDVRILIEKSRLEVAIIVNTELTILYWEIGTRIRKEILQESRAEYGKRIVHALSAILKNEYGRGFQEKNLWKMIQFAGIFVNREIVVSLTRQLSWTHFTALIPLKEPLKRDFYAEMCRIEKWSVRTLRKKIDSMLYERTALSRKPEETIKHDLAALREDDRITADLVFRDP